MDEKLWHLVVGKAEGVKHDRPVDAVGRDEDVFADDVQCGPFFAEGGGLIGEVLLRGIIANKADIIRQGIEPDVVDVVGIEGQLDAPTEPRFRT